MNAESMLNIYHLKCIKMLDAIKIFYLVIPTTVVNIKINLGEKKSSLSTSQLPPITKNCYQVFQSWRGKDELYKEGSGNSIPSSIPEQDVTK